MSTEFWVTTVIVTATPGTGVLFTLAAALARGHRAGLVAAFGCTLGVVPHMAAAITGPAAALHASAVALPSPPPSSSSAPASLRRVSDRPKTSRKDEESVGAG